MTGVKKAYKSKSVVAGISAILVFVSMALGFDLDKGSITEIVGTLAVLISQGVAIYGRITAKERLV